MKLFEMKEWQLTVSEEAWGLLPFKKILTRDKTKEKEIALAEMLFIWYYSDIRSDYLSMEKEDRVKEIIKDVDGLPKGWEPDEVIWNAVEFYQKHETVIQYLYRKAIEASHAVGEYLGESKQLLEDRDSNDRPIYKTADITRGLKDIKIIMKDLREAEKEVIKEQEDNSGKKKGSRSFNTFEDGLI